MILFVGLVEETAKLGPVFFFTKNIGKTVSPSTVAYLGVISGLAFGASEAAVYSLNIAFGHATLQIGYGDYLLIQLLRLISIPFLHAIWTGIAAYFIGLSLFNPSVRRVVILAGLFGVSILHGTYNTFAGGWVGFLVAILSFSIFVGYVRDEETAIMAVKNESEESVDSEDIDS